MARNTPKSKKMGYALEINRTGEPGKDNWSREGFLFDNSRDASDYRLKHYPNIESWRIFAIRLPLTTLSAFGSDNESRMSPSTKGNQRAS